MSYLQRYMLDRETVERRIVQNFVEATLLHPGESQAFLEGMDRYTDKEILELLIQSHDIREQVSYHCKFYPIDMRYVSRN